MRSRAHRLLILAGLLAAIGVMTILVSYSVTLYRLFCSVTGAGGTTQRVAADTEQVDARRIRVRFNTDVAPGMPWTFVPDTPFVDTRLGEQTTVTFSATNNADHPIVGHATFNVTPDKAGIYFKKIQCFCFSEERLDPHATVHMPVEFFVDPRLGRDANAQDVQTITLSYTFFESKRPDAAQNLARLNVTASTPPDATRGAALFAATCAACHALDHSKVGPALAHIVGRKAGTVPGYPYSAALQKSGITWTPDTLAGWLAGPQAYVPGALMPVAVGTEQDRRDIIAYLQQN